MSAPAHLFPYRVSAGDMRCKFKKLKSDSKKNLLIICDFCLKFKNIQKT